VTSPRLRGPSRHVVAEAHAGRLDMLEAKPLVACMLCIHGAERSPVLYLPL